MLFKRQLGIEMQAGEIYVLNKLSNGPKRVKGVVGAPVNFRKILIYIQFESYKCCLYFGLPFVLY